VAKLLILDFDGTFTDAEEEGRPFTESVMGGVAILARLPVADVREAWGMYARRIADDPGKYPHMRGGYAVAPANADPYLRMRPILGMFFKDLGIFLKEDDLDRLNDFLFRTNYGLGGRPVFKKGAANALVRLHGKPVYIVTNSETEAVKSKLRVLGSDSDDPGSVSPEFLWLMERVHGLARKFDVTPDFVWVSESMQIPGCGWPVLLRRGYYFEVVDEIRKRHHMAWEDVVVVGDIFQLDLAPLIDMGLEVVLVPNQNTSEYEVAFVENHLRGRVIRDLSEIPSLIP